jgi:hypothetical protein
MFPELEGEQVRYVASALGETAGARKGL